MQNLLKLAVFLFPVILLYGCDLEKEIELNLPEYEPQLSVECYLEPGKPLRASIFESTSFFDRPEPIIVLDASVFITHNGVTDTLRFRPGIDTLTKKFFTHVSDKIVTGKPGDAYSILVKDSRGRQVTGNTQFLNKVEFDSIRWSFNASGKANLSASFFDDPKARNFYRFQVHKDTLAQGKLADNDYLSDRLFNGKKMIAQTGFEFGQGDTLFVTLFHIREDYYDFARSMREAQNANGNPFAQPTSLRSTVQGGIGIFTTLIYDRRTVILK